MWDKEVLSYHMYQATGTNTCHICEQGIMAMNVWVSVNMQSKKVLSCVKLARVYQSHICEQVLAYGRYGTPAAAM